MKLYKPLCKIGLALFFLAISLNCFSQRVGVKTNVLGWSTLSPNIGVEFRLSRHFTLNVEGLGNLVGQHYGRTHTAALMPEARYWFSARPQAGHFIGVMGAGCMYQWRLYDTYYLGDAVGAGLTYGYSFVLNKRWSLETTLGAGWLHIREKRYNEGDEIPQLANRSKDMFAPLKLGVTFVYLIK